VRSILVLGLVFGLASAIPSATAPLPFRLVNTSDLIVPVMLGGQGPFRFLFDTGSTRTTVSAKMAHRLGLRPVAKTVMVTPAGRSTRLVALLERLTVGAAGPTSVRAMIVPDDDLGHGIDGLVGQDVLAALTYTIDYTQGHVMWHPSGVEHVSGVRLPLEFSEGRPIVSLRQRADKSDALQLIPDSGADALVLFARPGRALPLLTLLDVGGLRTLSGQQLVRRVMVDDLDVGAIRLRDQIAVIVSRPEADAPLGDGLLPLHLFARVTFDGTRKELIVEAR
jgi:predicted aspartyl protease